MVILFGAEAGRTKRNQIDSKARHTRHTRNAGAKNNRLADNMVQVLRGVRVCRRMTVELQFTSSSTPGATGQVSGCSDHEGFSGAGAGAGAGGLFFKSERCENRLPRED